VTEAAAGDSVGVGAVIALGDAYYRYNGIAAHDFSKLISCTGGVLTPFFKHLTFNVRSAPMSMAVIARVT
jgi:hypothetical protein